jgi:hypothetical protein
MESLINILCDTCLRHKQNKKSRHRTIATRLIFIRPTMGTTSTPAIFGILCWIRGGFTEASKRGPCAELLI